MGSVVVGDMTLAGLWRFENSTKDKEVDAYTSSRSTASLLNSAWVVSKLRNLNVEIDIVVCRYHTSFEGRKSFTGDFVKIERTFLVGVGEFMNFGGRHVTVRMD